MCTWDTPSHTQSRCFLDLWKAMYFSSLSRGILVPSFPQPLPSRSNAGMKSVPCTTRRNASALAVGLHGSLPLRLMKTPPGSLTAGRGSWFSKFYCSLNASTSMLSWISSFPFLNFFCQLTECLWLTGNKLMFKSLKSSRWFDCQYFRTIQIKYLKKWPLIVKKWETCCRGPFSLVIA